jgi:hypothetical protein
VLGMTRDTLIRRVHRWMSITFTATVVLIFAALALGEPAGWLYFLPVLPLLLLVVTGLYLFALPYLVNRRRAATPGASRS